MSKFQLEQKVFFIEEREQSKKANCKDCNGKGRVPSRIIGKTIKCSVCKGTGVNNVTSTKYDICMARIIDVITWKSTDSQVDLEMYLLNRDDRHVNDKLYVSNQQNAIAYMKIFCDWLFTGGYNNVDLEEEYIVSYTKLFESEEEAIKEAKRIKKANL